MRCTTAAFTSNRRVFGRFLAVGLAIVVSMGAAASAADVPAVLGQVGFHLVGRGENLLDIARQYDLGYVELIAANPNVDPWVPREGTMVTLPMAHIPPPSPRRGIVINLSEMRLYWYAEPDSVPETFPVGIGQAGVWLGQGKTSVVRKRINPTWVVPRSIRAEEPYLPAQVPPGPDNPLGAYALDLAGDSLRIHGTNKADAVGRRVSHGCYRMYPEDIERLFPEVPVGTPVTVVDQSAALTWIGDDLYLQIHPSPAQADQLEDGRKPTPAPVTGLDATIRRIAGDQVERIDWDAVTSAELLRQGIPEKITRPAEATPAGEGGSH